LILVDIWYSENLILVHYITYIVVWYMSPDKN